MFSFSWEQIWLLHFKIPNLDMNNFDAIAAVNLKLTVIILSPFCYTCQEFQAWCAEHLYYPWSKIGRFIPLI